MIRTLIGNLMVQIVLKVAGLLLDMVASMLDMIGLDWLIGMEMFDNFDMLVGVVCIVGWFLGGMWWGKL